MDHDHSTRSQHVHFGDELSSAGHNADIQVQIMNQFLIKVHLGFLQVRHRYEIAFNFECPDSMENVFDLQTCALPGHVRITELKAIKPTTDNGQNTLHKCTCILYAYKEKLLKEKVFLQSKSQRTQSLTFIFYGRVLGNGKGTPFLKQGIKCIGFDAENDDEEEEENIDA